MHKLSNNLKQYRELRMLTQKGMAELLDITTRSYQRYESGDREPSIATLIIIADLLNIPLDELVGRTFS